MAHQLILVFCLLIGILLTATQSVVSSVDDRRSSLLVAARSKGFEHEMTQQLASRVEIDHHKADIVGDNNPPQLQVKGKVKSSTKKGSTKKFKTKKSVKVRNRLLYNFP